MLNLIKSIFTSAPAMKASKSKEGKVAKAIASTPFINKMIGMREKWEQCRIKNGLHTNGKDRLQEWMKFFKDFMNLAETWTNDTGYINDLIQEQKLNDWKGQIQNFILVCNLLKEYGFHHPALDKLIELISNDKGEAVNLRQLFQCLYRTTPINVGIMASTLGRVEPSDSSTCSSNSYCGASSHDHVEKNSERRHKEAQNFFNYEHRHGPTTHLVGDVKLKENKYIVIAGGTARDMYIFLTEWMKEIPADDLKNWRVVILYHLERLGIKQRLLLLNK